MCVHYLDFLAGLKMSGLWWTSSFPMTVQFHSSQWDSGNYIDRESIKLIFRQRMWKWQNARSHDFISERRLGSQPWNFEKWRFLRRILYQPWVSHLDHDRARLSDSDNLNFWNFHSSFSNFLLRPGQMNFRFTSAQTSGKKNFKKKK